MHCWAARWRSLTGTCLLTASKHLGMRTQLTGVILWLSSTCSMTAHQHMHGKLTGVTNKPSIECAKQGVCCYSPGCGRRPALLYIVELALRCAVLLRRWDSLPLPSRVNLLMSLQHTICWLREVVAVFAPCISTEALAATVGAENTQAT
jgi:hypothetical protein